MTMEHMGRSEAPLSTDYWEGIPGGANRKTSRVVLSRIALHGAGDTRAARRLRGSAALIISTIGKAAGD